MKEVKPRPQDDEAMAKIWKWLVENKLIARVSINGIIKLEPKD